MKVKIAHVKFEDCKRLHQSMREAERECYDLQKNVNAWKCLNRGKLVDYLSRNMYVKSMKC